MTDLAYLSVAEAADLLRRKKLSPVEYTRALIARIEKHDGQLNAFIHFTPEIAMEDARSAESEIVRGAWRGTFHGVPYGLKDIIDYAGLPTTAHSKILRDNVAKDDATVTKKLKAAGGVFMGKLSTHEFACGGPSLDLPWPPAKNPWNCDHFCGGSSSGSGVATAAGFLPATIGTDTAGSVRNPASMCGVVGMKPTYGTVSRHGVFPLSFSLDHVGPITRTVRDNALMLDVMAGYDPLDPASIDQPTGGYSTLLDREIKGIRVGVIRHFYRRDMQADPEIADAIECATTRLTELGATIREIEADPLKSFGQCLDTILYTEAYSVHEKWLRERPEDYSEMTRERIMGGALTRGVDYVNAQRARRKLADTFHALFSDIDVMITANSMDPPCFLDADFKEFLHTRTRQARVAFNVTGSPALAVPAGFSRAGLPLGFQLVGATFKEALVYQVAHAYELANAESIKRRPSLGSHE